MSRSKSSMTIFSIPLSYYKCPLDYGRHVLDPAVRLGNLGRLPTETMHQVLVSVDLKSLLVFRRVNQAARRVVDRMKWAKDVGGRLNAEVVPKSHIGYELKNLGTLPTETWHQVLGFLDVQLLLVFRRLNQKAMGIVDGMVLWQKIMAHASNTIRMAIGIRTAHTFTLPQLFAKLCQKTCDVKGCGILAPYLDVFTLSRRCLTVGGRCPKTRGPRPIDELHPEMSLSRVPMFRAIPGKYGDGSHKLVIPEQDRPEWLRRSIFGPAASTSPTESRLTAPWGSAPPNALLRQRTPPLNPHWKLSAVVAPWLQEKGPGAEYGVFCDVCVQKKIDILWQTNYWGHRRETVVQGPIDATFGTVPDIEQHKREKHAEQDHTVGRPS